jgi:hypothetical protein
MCNVLWDETELTKTLSEFIQSECVFDIILKQFTIIIYENINFVSRLSNIIFHPRLFIKVVCTELNNVLISYTVHMFDACYIVYIKFDFYIRVS